MKGKRGRNNGVGNVLDHSAALRSVGQNDRMPREGVTGSQSSAGGGPGDFGLSRSTVVA